MSTAASLITFDEFLELPDVEGEKRELLDGEVLVTHTMPPPKHSHNRIAKGIFVRLLARFGEDRTWYDAEGYRIGENWLIPDVSVTWPDQEYPGDYALRSPMIAVEVLSAEKKQLLKKIKRFFEGGAQEVWVVDGEGRTLTAHVKRDDRVDWDTFERRFTSEAAGLTIELDEIFG